ncbi:MAG: metallophosphoesterase [Anaerolineae bacterium]
MTLTRRRFLKVALGSAAAVSLGGGLYVSQIEPEWVEITQIHFTLPRLDRVFEGFRILHMTDFHVDNRFMNRERLMSIIDLALTQPADMILVTGDFVTDGVSPEIQAALTDAFSRLSAPYGKFYVTGNHDHWSGVNNVRAAVNPAGMIEVKNTAVPIQRGEKQFYLAGVGDVWEALDDMPQTLASFPENAPAILMAHEPDYADTAALTGRFDLQLSGHSHGGQVNLPGFGPLILPRWGRIYHTGQYQVGRMIQYTNRGLGVLSGNGWMPPIRFNCRPEIAIITLHAP